MPITWTAEADAKLFMGVLAQLKVLKVKLDHEALAKYMGDDVTACAIDNRIIRLRRLVETGDGPNAAPGTPSQTSSKASKSPAKSPTKRKSTDTPKAGKKSKEKLAGEDADVPMEEGWVKDDEDKVKVEVQIKGEALDSD